MVYMASQNGPASQPEPVTAYREQTINGTLFRVTSVFTGKIDLKDALEDLTVRRVVRETLDPREKM